MAKTLRIVRISLITLQLISLTVASAIIVVHYNPWIERIIEEAEQKTQQKPGSETGSPDDLDEHSRLAAELGHSLAEQFNRVDGEEVVIFLMSAATILVSVLGIVGTLRGTGSGNSGSGSSRSSRTSSLAAVVQASHNNCLLNFYMSTLIVFLFVIFMALCGTLWEVISKLQASSHSTSAGSGLLQVHQLSNAVAASTANPFDSSYDLVEETNSTVGGRNSNYFPATTISTQTTVPKPSSTEVSWLYIAKSLLFISLSAILFTVSLKLTRRILESIDDERYLSASDDDMEDRDDLNSETSSGIVHPPLNSYIIGGAFHSYSNRNFHSNIAGVYSTSKGGRNSGNKKEGSSMGGGSSNETVPGSPFRNV